MGMIRRYHHRPHRRDPIEIGRSIRSAKAVALRLTMDERSAKALERVKQSRTTQKPRNPQREMPKVFLRVLRVLRSASYFFTDSEGRALPESRRAVPESCRSRQKRLR